MKNSVNTYKMDSTRMLMILTLVLSLVLCMVIKGFAQPAPPDTTKGSSSVPMLTLQGYFSANNGLSDATVIYFDPNASNNFSGHTDESKLMNSDPSYPNIYTIKNRVACTIEGLPDITDSLVVPLGFDVRTDGSYTISVYQFLDFSSSVHIYLEDLTAGITQDLTLYPSYSFIIRSADKGGRFFLKFSLSVAGIKNYSNTMNYNVYAYDKNLHISYNNPYNDNALITMFNLAGQKVMEKQIDNGNYNFNINYAPGCYLVRMVNKNKVQTNKIYIK